MKHIATLALALILGFVLGALFARHVYQQAAVDHGAAEWISTTSKTGHLQRRFLWTPKTGR